MVGERLDLSTLRRHRADLVDVCIGAADAALGPDRAARTTAAQLRTVVPRLLPACLDAMETGRALTDRELAPLRGNAARLAAEQVSLPTPLLCMGPSLGVFAAAVGADALAVPPSARAVLLARAAALTHQMSVVLATVWADPAVDDDLDPQDRDMLALLAGGHATTEIARATAYSPQAVRWRLGRLMRRWDVSNRPALVAAAYERGVLSRRGRTGSRPAWPC